MRKNQFTYIPDTSRRGDKIGIALLTDYDEGLVSNVYTVFEIIDVTKLIPEYLMLWFSRPEFDRYARYKSHGSVREIFDWEQMCNVELPIPPLEEQKRIVDEYNVINKRIALKKKINENLEEQIKCLFNNSFGKVIKLTSKLPEGWILDKAQNIYNISVGKTPPRKRLDCFTTNQVGTKWVSIADMGSNGMFILKTSENLTEEAIKEFKVKLIPKNTVIYSFKMTNGRTSITTEECATNEAIAHFGTDDISLSLYAYCYLNLFRFSDLGSTSSITEAVNSTIIKSMPFVILPQKVLDNFAMSVIPIFKQIKLNLCEIMLSVDILDSFLSMLSL